MSVHTFVATGDSIISRRVSNRTDKPFLDLVELIRSADSAFTNLELVTPARAVDTFFGVRRAAPGIARVRSGRIEVDGIQPVLRGEQPLCGLHVPGPGGHGGRAEPAWARSRRRGHDAGRGAQSRIPGYAGGKGGLACVRIHVFSQRAGLGQPAGHGRAGRA